MGVLCDGMTEKAVNYVAGIVRKGKYKKSIHIKYHWSSRGTVLSISLNSTGIIPLCQLMNIKCFHPMAAVLEELGKKKVHGRKL